jgi:hypothetical protein
MPKGIGALAAEALARPGGIHYSDATSTTAGGQAGYAPDCKSE